LRLDNRISNFGVDINGEGYVLRGIRTYELQKSDLSLIRGQMQRMIDSQVDMVDIEFLV